MSESKTQDGVVALDDVRIAFPALFEAKAQSNDKTAKPKFNASFILAKNNPAIAAIYAAMEKAAVAKWGAKAADIVKGLKASDKLALHDGDAKTQYQGFAGNLYVSASSSARPLVIDRDRSMLTEADGKPYAGSYVNARVQIWAQDNQFGKRINAQVLGVQFVRDGERFAGGAVASADDFETIPDAATGAAPASAMFE